MPSTRQSARQSDSSPATEKTTAGTKRKASEATSLESAKSKRPSKEQKTLEESFPEKQNGDAEMEDVVSEEVKADQNGGDDKKEKETDGTEVQTNGTEKNGTVENGEEEKSALDSVKADEKEDSATTKPEENGHTANGESKGTAVEEDQDRENAQPSNVLEKGIIYFFTRGRVNTDDPSNVTELQRSFFVLRPLPAGAKLTDGAVQDVGNNRLIALPKKVWPKSGKDRFMAFVEKSAASMATLKETFFSGSDYSTKTVGTRHTPEVTPIGEGVYALTSTGDGRSTSHLAYMLTIPQELGEVQKDIGLAEKGSFVLSTKNPESSSPSYAQLPASPAYPKEILDEFGARSWLPTKPEHLNHENASFLLIGEDIEMGSALEGTAQDQQNDDKEVPEEELHKLEEEDEERIKNLKGDNSIYEDLGISSKDYPKVKSTW